MTAHDPETLAFYDREAAVYAGRYGKDGPNRALAMFLDLLSPGAKVLELGCGGGQDAQAMIAAGLDVTPTDGSPGLAKQAEARLGRPVLVMRFDELEAEAAYDAVWANACLLHAPASALSGILACIHRALRPGGLFYASYKAGDGADRDALGRYYNFPTRQALEAAYASAGPWVETTVNETEGGGYDGVARTWLHVLVCKGR